METQISTPRRKGWAIFRPTETVERVLQELVLVYSEIAPTSAEDEMAFIILEKALQDLLECRQLNRGIRTTDNYVWALEVELAACVGLSGRINILLPYAAGGGNDIQNLDRQIAVYVHGKVRMDNIKQLLRAVLRALNR